MSKVYLIVGLTGAGKSTYSRELSKKESALHLSIDEWMKTLFWMDANPNNPDIHWAMERVHRVEALMEQIVLQEVKLGHKVILDLGFSKKEQRARWTTWLTEHQTSFEMIYLDVPKETRWTRVENRNQSLDEQSIPVDRRTFEFMEGFFDQLSEEELKHTRKHS